MDALDPVVALERIGGVADGTALRVACGAWPIRKAVAEGRILHLGRNRYALPAAHEAQLAAGRLHGVASHLSAAMAWGWKVKRPPPRPVVTVRRGHNLDPQRRHGVDVHFRHLAASDVHAGLLTGRVRTVVDCARDLPFDEALCVADSALREGSVSRTELLAAVEAAPRTGRTRALRVVSLADARAANPFESCLRAIAVDVPGLEVVPQLVIPGIGHADLGDARLRLAIEADSFEFHAGRDAFRYDVRRYTAMVRSAWTVLRFCWEDVMSRPASVSDTISDVVARLALDRRPGHRCAGCPAA